MRRRHETVIIGVLAWLAGFVDAIGVAHLGKFFVSFMSGNTTQSGVALANGRFAEFGLGLGLIAAFVLGVVVASLLVRGGEQRSWQVCAVVAGILAAAAALAAVPAATLLAPPLMAVAMGAENIVFARGREIGVGITYVTGTLVTVGHSIAAAIAGEKNGAGPSGEWLRGLLLWLALALGTVAGGASFLWVGLASLWIATALMVAAAVAVRAARPARFGESGSP